MTVEQIEAQIKKLQEQKKAKVAQEREKERRAEQQKREEKRKIEDRVKYIIGGHVLSIKPDYVQNLLNSDKLREQDKKTLQKYIG